VSTIPFPHLVRPPPRKQERSCPDRRRDLVGDSLNLMLPSVVVSVVLMGVQLLPNKMCTTQHCSSFQRLYWAGGDFFPSSTFPFPEREKDTRSKCGVVRSMERLGGRAPGEHAFKSFLRQFSVLCSFLTQKKKSSQGRPDCVLTIPGRELFYAFERLLPPPSPTRSRVSAMGLSGRTFFLLSNYNK